MEEIKVGKYGLESKTEGMLARTTNGIIGIIINANEDEMMNGPELKVSEKIYCVERDSIKEIKENIIDLIEVGDIVEYQVNSLSELKVGIVKSYRDARSNKEYLGVERFDITKIYIKTILTHEQFEQNCYKLD